MTIYKNNWLHFLMIEEGEKKKSEKKKLAGEALLHCLILTSTLPLSDWGQAHLSSRVSWLDLQLGCFEGFPFFAPSGFGPNSEYSHANMAG